MKDETRKVLVGLTSATLLASSYGTTAALAAVPQDVSTGDTVVNSQVINGHQVQTIQGRANVDYTSVANVKGTFAFNQDETTPNDQIFSIFGATLERMCSKPSLSNPDAPGVANYYINIGGDIKKAFSVNVADMKDQSSVQKVWACSCASGSPMAQAAVMGVPVSEVVELAELSEGVNTFTAFGADGAGIAMPLQYVLDKNALLVYQVNGEQIANGTTQLWMPDTVAAYFTRDVVDIQLTAEETVPAVATVNPNYRNKINIVNSSDTCVFHVGDAITFQGHADDVGTPIEAVEFSLDGGNTWTTCPTTGATSDRWVAWAFTTSVDAPGNYVLTARARTADGVVSPLEATVEFTVE